MCKYQIKQISVFKKKKLFLVYASMGKRVFCNPLRVCYQLCYISLRQFLCCLLTRLCGDIIDRRKYKRVPGIEPEEDITVVPSGTFPMKDNSRHLQECAHYTVENVRYDLGEPPMVEHSNEDRFFVASTGYQVVALFDGHDGSRAVDHVCQYVGNRLNMTKPESVNMSTLENVFLETEKNFFETIRDCVKEKQALEAIIPSVSVVSYPDPNVRNAPVIVTWVPPHWGQCWDLTFIKGELPRLLYILILFGQYEVSIRLYVYYKFQRLIML